MDHDQRTRAQKLHREIPVAHESINLSSLAENVVEHLFNGTTHVPATSREIFKYNLGVRKTFGARARYLLYMLRPTDGDLASHSLPASLNFAYYLTRPFRLFRTKI